MLKFFARKGWKYLVDSNIHRTFAEQKRETLLAKLGNAEIAQLVEHNLAKVRVAGSSPVFRSIIEL